MSLSEADRAAVAVLRASVLKLGRRLRNQRADESLSPTQLSVLTILVARGAMTPGELARHEKVQPPSMTRVIAGLEERGLVRRDPHPEDRRQITVTVTEPAAEVVAESRKLGNAWLAAHLEALSEEELAALRAAVPVLERLAQL
ncbi:MarR family transcriptional regulator [Yinghuangia sp. ASG 101]|uniref:MarR family winged helix-turn-helix transcriptional regulator n=1 Tax=Yinghuangia sp. ASG 101 TaxID=2896848 RepID=UPI001E4A7817|nr:MarR family transcriptional regulator [Yinghuangia sp. ASG 101]UGQ14796.1 MarR family transcriptional regulator [Yinghuangia sp. ASG 101]